MKENEEQRRRPRRRGVRKAGDSPITLVLSCFCTCRCDPFSLEVKVKKKSSGFSVCLIRYLMSVHVRSSLQKSQKSDRPDMALKTKKKGKNFKMRTRGRKWVLERVCDLLPQRERKDDGQAATTARVTACQRRSGRCRVLAAPPAAPGTSSSSPPSAPPASSAGLRSPRSSRRSAAPLCWPSPWLP